ncbi:transmembrane 220 family protein [Actomonas aquatica]|uniref:Transmembrane 220 family protein n=1 Tax=Actomonas aquatica TaxID=2866162 RepID=A0ABZ1C914_9BACT|nr:transmembrane 220 family protein [Opitutus sp. WL0086]WRQ87069.1 transmembrane 220 family protein [Opitutus sp. WL0086]
MLLALRILHGIMAALFVLSALVQYNDPSPAPWILLYAAAATAAGFAAAGRSTSWLAPALIVVCLWWEMYYIRLGAWHTPFTDLTEEWHMTDQTIVDGREFYALILIAFWMAVVMLSRPRSRAPTAADNDASRDA